LHTNQLGIASLSAGVTTTLYTVPTGKRTILKSVIVNNNHNAANNVSVYVYVGSLPVFIMTFYMAADGVDGDTKFALPWLVLEAGQILKAAPQFSTAYVACSGSELDTS
jgi:hypothetical protein